MNIRGLRDILEKKLEDIPVPKSLLDDYNRMLLKKDLEGRRPRTSGLYRPSSLGGCKRMLYFMRTNAKEDEINTKNEWTYKLIDITGSGTDRHSRIQEVFQLMETEGILTNIDIETHVNSLKNIDTDFVGWNEDRTEGKCRSNDYLLSFMADGLIKYRGKLYLIEIKTTNGFKYQKIVKTNTPPPEHIDQVTCYAMSLGVDNVLFIYEDNNFKAKYIIEHTVTEYDKLRIQNKIKEVESFVERKEIPPTEKDKCMYCSYKSLCKEVGK